MGVFSSLGDILTIAYNNLVEAMPAWAQSFISFFVIALLIVVYAFFVWGFYQSLGKKDILGLNLNKYNKSKHPIMTKFVAGSLYFLEYILIAPIAIFVWFTVFTALLILLTEGVAVPTLLILSGTTIAAIRIVSYHNQNLSKDIAKLVPFTLLATSLLNPDFFSVERILGGLQAIPGAFDKLFLYLLFIVLLEIILRAFDFLISLFQWGDGIIKNDEENNKK